MRSQDYKPLIVTYKNGAPVRLGDVAHVIDSVEDDKNFSKIYGGEYGKEGTMGVNLMVMRQPGSNTIEVTDNIKRLLPTFQASLPPSVHLGIRGDRSKNIREAFNDIQFTMAVTLALVIMVIFLFLRNVSATMIPAMALPFSMIGTFSVMYLLRFQPEQHLHDGADPLHRLRGGRRHRHAGEYRSPHRNGRDTAWKRRSTGRARSASRSFR